MFDIEGRRLPLADMFDSIAPRYDILNRVLSFRRDVVWRRRLADLVKFHRPVRVLDLATGTGDVLLALARADAARVAVGVDLAREMLALARRKLDERGVSRPYSVVQGDAGAASFADCSFDAVTVAFGVRNMPDVGVALREMFRLLRPGGRCYVLEFSLPPNRLIRGGYLVYFRYAVPALGGWLARNREAYAYLNRSVEHFPRGRDFCDLMAAAGFDEVMFEPLTFGVAAIYHGVKPNG